MVKVYRCNAEKGNEFCFYPVKSYIRSKLNRRSRTVSHTFVSDFTSYLGFNPSIDQTGIQSVFFVSHCRSIISDNNKISICFSLLIKFICKYLFCQLVLIKAFPLITQSFASQRTQKFYFKERKRKLEFKGKCFLTFLIFCRTKTTIYK